MKNKDKLEKFVDQVRESFDYEVPDEKIWKSVLFHIKVKSSSYVWYKTGFYRGIAAGFILLIIGGYLGFLIGYNNDSSLWNKGLEPKPFKDFETVSQISIQEKVLQLKRLDAEESIYTDLQQIDRSMEELKRELKTIPMGQEKIILEQLRLGYQTKIEILDKILQRLEQKKQNQNEKEI